MLQLQAGGLLHCDGPAHTLLQPLLVAALAARHQLLEQLQGSGVWVDATADLAGPADLMHLQLLLRQVAAATAAAASLQLSTNSSSSSVHSSSTAACKPLKHLTRLPLDLQQLQQLLHWAIFGPSCSSEHAWQLSQQALQANLTADKLGVRELRIWGASAGFSEVQVLGGCIADAAEDAARQLGVLQRARQQQQMQLVGLQISAAGCRGEAGVDEEVLDRLVPSCEASSAKEHDVEHLAELRSGDGASDGLDAPSDCEEEADDATSCSKCGDDLLETDRSTTAAAAAAVAVRTWHSVDGDCVVPLGLSLSSDELWGLLVQRMAG
jgi:hypothetical protein